MFKPKYKKRSVSVHPAPKAISFFLCFIFLIKPVSIQPKIKTKIEFDKIIVNSFIPNDSLTTVRNARSILRNTVICILNV